MAVREQGKCWFEGQPCSVLEASLQQFGREYCSSFGSVACRTPGTDRGRDPQGAGMLRRERLAERRAFEEMFEQLKDFASSGRLERATQWPKDSWPTPLSTLGVESVQAFADHLAGVLAEQGFAAYTMQLLHTLRHELERHFGWVQGGR